MNNSFGHSLKKFSSIARTSTIVSLEVTEAKKTDYRASGKGEIQSSNNYTNM